MYLETCAAVGPLEQSHNQSPGRHFDQWRTPPTTIEPCELRNFETHPELITFDAFGTLIYPSQSVGRWYREALNMHTGMRYQLPCPALFTAAFDDVMKDMSVRHPCFGACSGMSSREWWLQVVDATYRSTEGVKSVLIPDELTQAIPGAFEMLYSDVFSTPEGWLLKDDALYTLSRLQQWRKQGAGPKLGVISNFDERLEGILEGLGVTPYFDAGLILDSFSCRSEKPAPGMFNEAQSRAGVMDASKCFHVGDSVSRDVQGATIAGWVPVRFNEYFDGDIPEREAVELPKDAEKRALTRERSLQWGRRDSVTGLQWYELSRLGDVLTLCCCPADDDEDNSNHSHEEPPG